LWLSAGESVVTGVVITVASGVVLASRPGPSTRTARSRSVTIPTTHPSSCTITAPMLLFSIARAASRTGVLDLSATIRGIRYHLRDMLTILLSGTTRCALAHGGSGERFLGVQQANLGRGF